MSKYTGIKEILKKFRERLIRDDEKSDKTTWSSEKTQTQINALTSIQFTSAAKKWFAFSDTGNGVKIIHYEGQDVTTYKLPNTYCEVIVNRGGKNRGTAIAIVWVSSGNTKTYVNRLHDDTGSDSWGSWVELINANGGTVNGKLIVQTLVLNSGGYMTYNSNTKSIDFTVS